MFRCIFCDLDGTLYDKNNRISLKNTQAIRKAMQYGIKFVPTTGRHFSTFESLKNDAGIEFDSIICNNGSQIYRDGEPVALHPLPLKWLGEVVRYALDKPVSMSLFGLNSSFSRNDTEYIHHSLYDKDRLFLSGEEILNIALSSKPIYKVGLSGRDADYLVSLRKELNDHCLGNVEIVSSSPHLIEVGKKGISKGSAIREYCDLLNVDINDTIAIGDSDNDLEMLHTVGYAACVANSLEIVKKQCDYVSACDSFDGVADVIEQIVLKERI